MLSEPVLTEAVRSETVRPRILSKMQTAQIAFVVKWAASIVQILGYGATGLGLTPWNIYLFLVGVIGWFVVGVFWKDRALMLIHAVALSAMLVGVSS